MTRFQQQRKAFRGTTLCQRWPVDAQVMVLIDDPRYRGKRLRGQVRSHQNPHQVFVDFSGREVSEIDGLLLRMMKRLGVHERQLIRVGEIELPTAT